jgi:biotin synthase
MVGFTDHVTNATEETRVRALIEKAAVTSCLEPTDLLTLLRANTWQAESLFSAADDVRKHTVGDAIELWGIIEFSNSCARNCLYCGMRVGNTPIERYRIPVDEILKICETMRGLGINTVLLESGEDRTYTVDALSKMVHEIKKNLGMGVSLSIGERAFSELRALKGAGADHYLLKHETSDASLYERLHPQMSFLERLSYMAELRRLGYGIGGGSLVGFPGQTTSSLVHDVSLFQSLKLDMAVIGPFIPASGTPMEFEGETWRFRRAPAPSSLDKRHTVAEFVLKLLALTRLLVPRALLPSTTALASLLPRGREMGLLAGANMVMLNFTPRQYKELFRVYDDRISTRESAEDALTGVKALAEKLGRNVC